MIAYYVLKELHGSSRVTHNVLAALHLFRIRPHFLSALHPPTLLPPQPQKSSRHHEGVYCPRNIAQPELPESVTDCSRGQYVFAEDQNRISATTDLVGKTRKGRRGMR